MCARFTQGWPPAGTRRPDTDGGRGTRGWAPASPRPGRHLRMPAHSRGALTFHLKSVRRV